MQIEGRGTVMRHRMLLYVWALAATLGMSHFMSHWGSRPDSSELTKKTLPPVVVRSTPRIKAEAIVPGPRPASIDGAVFLNAGDFHHAAISEGTWVCIEGTVKRTMFRFGADDVLIDCDRCKWPVGCSIPVGMGLDDIPRDINIVIRGQVSYVPYLYNTRLVTQDEIDRAVQNSE